ncbi:MAG: hypothetical protein AAFV07_08910 [Bacteroidota bacterium]
MKPTRNRNIPWLIAGLMAMATALIHTFGGQTTLVDPLMSSNLSPQVTGELWGAWHMITGFLFLSAVVILRQALKGNRTDNRSLMQFLGGLYVLTAVPFAFGSLYFGLFLPQWILILPIGLLILLGLRR